MILPRGPLISAGPASSSRLGQAQPTSPVASVRRRVAARRRVLDYLIIYVAGTRIARIVRQSLTSSELCPLLLQSLTLHRALMGHRPSHFFCGQRLSPLRSMLNRAMVSDLPLPKNQSTVKAMMDSCSVCPRQNLVSRAIYRLISSH